MKILFICTAHNSLSQRLSLELSKNHTVAVEYALSDSVMIEAATLCQPDLIICPFLTSRIPKEIYSQYMTLIIHPGPPGDVGPSAIDWLLIGDDGIDIETPKPQELDSLSPLGRSHWGVTVLQAIEEFDAGPIWAFEQFPVDIDDPTITKSTLYRGPITQAAVTATLAAVHRLETTTLLMQTSEPPPPAKTSGPAISLDLVPCPMFGKLSVIYQKPFQGGKTRHRPLLRAADRDFDVNRHTAKEISRRIRCSDSQPGALTKFLGQSLYVYGGLVEDSPLTRDANAPPGTIIGTRDEAICIATHDGKGVWITHLRRVKRKQDAALWPKVPATSCLLELQLLETKKLQQLTSPTPTSDRSKSSYPTFQEIWVEFKSTGDENKDVAYVYFEFYNGAMSSSQCARLVETLEYVVSTHTHKKPLSAVVLMGGNSYFSNGIHLNVIESASDAALESWNNINQINDVVFYMLHEFPKRNILTVAAIRGNCAAGGVALAAACDRVIVGSDVVLNPAYRALGLYGSEYHTISYTKRCGNVGASALLHDMLPVSATNAKLVGLVDHVIPGSGAKLIDGVKSQVTTILASSDSALPPSYWKAGVDLSTHALALARAAELAEMAKDFWSPRSDRYHLRRSDFVRKVKASATPLRFATHRRNLKGQQILDEDESDEFDSVDMFQKKTRQKIEEETYQKIFKDRGVIYPCYYNTDVVSH